MASSLALRKTDKQSVPEWFSKVEELLECPVCLEVPKGHIVQCASGHHICQSCRDQLTTCPTCRTIFLDTRNYFAEEIARTLQEAKKLEEQYEKVKLVSVSTQTDPKEIAPPFQECKKPTHKKDDTNEVTKQKKSYACPAVAYGLYPCRIGTCAMQLPYGRLIGHIQRNHGNTFYELTHYNGKFTQKWTFDSLTAQYHNFASHIKGMGLFFFSIEIASEGHMLANVFIANSPEVSEHFTCALRIGEGKNSHHCSGKVQSCRMQHERRRELFVYDGDIRRVTGGKPFACNLSIEYNPPIANQTYNCHEPGTGSGCPV